MHSDRFRYRLPPRLDGYKALVKHAMSAALLCVACVSLSCSAGHVAPDHVGSAGGKADSAGSDDPPPIIDELAYVAALSAQRPDLLANDCYNTLVLRPKFRDQLFEDDATYGSIMSAQYTPSERAEDLAWMRSHQDGELALCAQFPLLAGCTRICPQETTCAACADVPPPDTGVQPPYQPSGYGLCAFVGYAMNGSGPIYDPNGVIADWKVFFELSNPEQDLTPERYLVFSQQLAEAGFRGDSKTTTDPQLPGQVRFDYNNVIVHGHTPADARLAEQIGLAFFAGQLAGHARGLDVATAPNATNPLDWHHYLCSTLGDLSALSTEAVDFVSFHDPM
jgi:hypothetical protein